jgi:hypothetical protein
MLDKTRMISATRIVSRRVTFRTRKGSMLKAIVTLLVIVAAIATQLVAVIITVAIAPWCIILPH